MKLMRIKYPMTFMTGQQFFTIDEVRAIIELIENKPYMFNKDSNLLTITVDVSEDINFKKYYEKNNTTTIVDNSIILKEPKLK